MALIEKLDKFASKRSTYSQFELNKIPGIRDIHGSTISEVNHAAVLINLNDGVQDDCLSGSPDFLNESSNDTQVGASLLDVARNNYTP